MVPLGLADRLSLARAAGGEDSLHVVGRRRPAPWRTQAFGSVLRGIAEARGGHRPGRRRRSRSRPALRSASRSPRASPAGAATPPPRSMALSRPGAPSAPRDDRRRAATAAGSDVPFFLAGGPALVEGRGERVTPLQHAPRRAARGAARHTGAADLHAGGLRAHSTPTRRRPGQAPARRACRRSTSRPSSGPGTRRCAAPTWCCAPACWPSPTTSQTPPTSFCPGCAPSAAPSPGSSALRSASPAPARPSGRSILPSRTPRRPPLGFARRSGLGAARQPRRRPAVRRRTPTIASHARTGREP